MVMVACRSSEQMDLEGKCAIFFFGTSLLWRENVGMICSCRRYSFVVNGARRGGVERGTVSAGSVGSRQVKAKAGGC